MELVAWTTGWLLNRAISQPAHQTAGVVAAGECLARQVDQGGLGAVAAEFDGVDKVFSAATKLRNALLGREVFEFDMLGGGLALVFEGLELVLGGGERGEVTPGVAQETEGKFAGDGGAAGREDGKFDLRHRRRLFVTDQKCETGLIDFHNKQQFSSRGQDVWACAAVSYPPIYFSLSEY